MVKKESFSFKRILNQFMQASIQSIVSVVAEQSEHIVDWLKDISGLKRKIKKFLTVVVISAAGLGILGVGIAQYIASLYPNLANGLSYMLVGVILILIAWIYLKYNE